MFFPFSFWQVCASTIMGSCCVFSLTPVFFEYTAELTYPLSEGLSGGWLTLFYNLFGTIVFACSEENKYIGVIWIDWVLFVSCLGKIFWLSQPYLTGHPLLFIYKQNNICLKNWGLRFFSPDSNGFITEKLGKKSQSWGPFV